ncbi:MAG: hypothetical protein CSA76_01215 [Spirochaetales bacterium]|nr:MAG: hypothetical protein CSA76_01215 [Spirochaetales bacterium]
MSSRVSRMSFPAVLKLAKRRFLFYLVLFSFLAGLTALIMWFFHSRTFASTRLHMSYHVETGLAVQAEALNVSLKEIISDTLFLANLPEIPEGVISGDLSGVEELFASFASSKKHYSQIRLIDAEGMEKVRVDFNPNSLVIVPGEKLQNKSDRYYFLEALECRPGAVYVSPLDLNKEHGKIEHPLNPTIRFASKVYYDGGFQGIVILNYNAKNLLNQFDNFSAFYSGDYYLLNSDGYYLASPEVLDEWGFMFPDRENKRFDVDFPRDWKTLSNRNTRIFRKDLGVLVSRIIYLPGIASKHKWIAVNRITPGVLALKMRPYRRMLFLIFICLIPVHLLITGLLRKYLINELDRQEILYHAANYDELTGLPNRQMGIDCLEQMTAVCSRYQTGGAVLFIDLDGFKDVNDQLGHDAGDLILKEVARRLKTAIRHSDTAIRLGGDEFVVLVPYTSSIKSLEVVAQKLIDILLQPYRISGRVLHIGASIGVRRIQGNPADNEDAYSVLSPEKILQEADSAMYKAKNNGKGQYWFFDS